MVHQSPTNVIVDDSVLGQEFLPTDLAARHPQISLLEACLEPARHGRKPTHAWLHGSPGSGKTAVARAVLAKVVREAGVAGVAINCWERDSLYEVLDQMITDLKVFHAEEHRSSVKLERLKRCLGEKRLVILLDELDKVPPAERSKILYTLDEMGNTGLICVSCSLSALFELEERVRSRINPRTINFSPYSAEEIIEILTRRAHLAIASGACPPFLIKRIAAVCSGDARVAIQTLRNAAESAEHAGRASITPRDLVSGWHDSQQAKASDVLRRLTEDHRLLYGIVSRSKEILSTDLHRFYLKRCARHGRNPIAVRTFSGYVNQLVQMGLIRCERARVKGNVRLLKAAK